MKLSSIRNFTTVFIFILLSTSSAMAIINQTIADGLFSDGSIWSLGHTPQNNEEVIISHNVTLDKDFIIEEGLTIDAGASLIDNGNHTLQAGKSNGNNYVGLTINGILEIGNLILVKSASTVGANGSITVYNDFTTYIDGDMTINGTVQVGGNWNLSNGNVVTDGSGHLNVDGCLDNSGGGQVSNIEVNFCVANQGDCNVGPNMAELQALDNFDCGVLPTKITKVTAEYYADDKNVSVIWETAFEENNAYFIIERSEDGQSFEEVSVLEAEGDSKNIQTYEINDDNPINGKSYYRVVQMDLDGTAHYSKITKVNTRQQSNVLRAYPNPMTSNNLRIDLNDKNEAADIYVYNLDGQLIYEEHLLESDNIYATHQINIDTEFSVAIIQVIQGTEVYNLKIFKK